MIAAGLLLAGCGADSSERYVESVRQNIDKSSAEVASDDLLLELGNATCEQFDLGASFDSVASTYILNGVDAQDAGIIIASSVVYLCPEHQDRINAEVDRARMGMYNS